jgi:hypothetical protein
MRPTIGTRRADVYLRAATDLPLGSAVTFTPRVWTATLLTGPIPTDLAVTLRAVKAGRGVWARTNGPVAVRTAP